MPITPAECYAVPDEWREYFVLCLQVDEHLFDVTPCENGSADAVLFGSWMGVWFYRTLMKYRDDVIRDYGEAGWKVEFVEDPVRPDWMMFRAVSI